MDANIIHDITANKFEVLSPNVNHDTDELHPINIDTISESENALYMLYRKCFNVIVK
jgi:hypothetical protein